MGTTKTDTQTGQYAPGQLQNLQSLQGISVPLISGWMQNPTNNPWFQLQQQLGTRQAQNLGGTQTSNILRNLAASGLGGGSSSPFQMEMLQNQNRANSGMQSQLGFLNPMQNAQQLQLFGAGQAQGYRPFQTGQTNVEKTGGLGTWLPQVAGMGMGLLGAGLGGGPSMGDFIGAGGGAGGGMAGVLGSNPQWLGGQGGTGTGFNPATFGQGGIPTPPSMPSSWGPPQGGGAGGSGGFWGGNS